MAPFQAGGQQIMLSRIFVLVLLLAGTGHQVSAFFTSPRSRANRQTSAVQASSIGGYSAQSQNDFDKYGEYAQNYYDGDAIEQLYGRNPFKALQRLVEVGTPLATWYAGQKWDNATWSVPGLYTDAQKEVFKQERGRQLREALVGTNSVTFIKSGQALSLRPDLVKVPQYVAELAKLQDAVGTFPNAQAMAIIEEDLGAPPEEIFEFVYPEPVASASIGQVYKCRVRATGRLVAVKVQRPDAFRSAALDMFLLRKYARWFKEWKGLNSDLVGVADEFGKQLFGELNYEQEARNCRRFKELYGRIEGIYVPECVFELTSRRVLTMEWVEGTKGPWDEGGERMLAIGLQCSVLQILDSGFFHADPHRGNLLQTPDGRLAYLDFGMMANVSDTNRFGLVAASLGLQYRDLDLITRNLVTLGFLPDSTRVDVLIPALQEAFRDAAAGGSGANLNFTRLNTNIQELTYLLEFRVPPFYSLIVRTLTILEGLAKGVDPDFKLIRGAYPFIAKQILESNSEQFQNLVASVLVTEDKRIQWARLEQLLSISGAAQTASFQDLKQAQERADLQKKWGVPQSQQQKTAEDQPTTEEEEEEEVEVSLELATKVVNYLGSENGAFLREPLINELVETVDSLGIAGVNALSVATQGALPRSPYAPDRARVEVLARLLSQALERQPPAASPAAAPGGVGLGAAAGAAGGGLGGLPNLRSAAERGLAYVQDPRNQKALEPIVRQSSSLVAEVVARLLERNLVRASTAAVDLAFAAPSLLNPFGLLLDTLAPPGSARPAASSSSGGAPRPRR